ncbi:12805_t:CDS:2 [Entrophospora sp. SA101]|nr:5335_t:CDS:2 [Entrophospora sp. SA101]CAJ0760272.1 12805_t:CDS:2 [Entrophospora sp. SA101]CAJ0900606.1 3559_t:CDS:2 [Entrophospora sp. SA101]
MPKIVSSSTISSSEQVNKRPEQHLHVYYCLCNAKLEKLPRRKTDKAYIIANGKRIYKPDGYEKQFRLHCPRCNLLIAYEMTERRKNGQYTYIVEGSLTENQGVIPHESILDD